MVQRTPLPACAFLSMHGVCQYLKIGSMYPGTIWTEILSGTFQPVMYFHSFRIQGYNLSSQIFCQKEWAKLFYKAWQWLHLLFPTYLLVWGYSTPPQREIFGVYVGGIWPDPSAKERRGWCNSTLPGPSEGRSSMYSQPNPAPPVVFPLEMSHSLPHPGSQGTPPSHKEVQLDCN